jgi:hypothetical protein
VEEVVEKMKSKAFKDKSMEAKKIPWKGKRLIYLDAKKTKAGAVHKSVNVTREDKGPVKEVDDEWEALKQSIYDTLPFQLYKLCKQAPVVG